MLNNSPPSEGASTGVHDCCRSLCRETTSFKLADAALRVVQGATEEGEISLRRAVAMQRDITLFPASISLISGDT